MYTLYLIGNDGEKYAYAMFPDKRKAKQEGENLKSAGLAKRYRVKPRPSTRALREILTRKNRRIR